MKWKWDFSSWTLKLGSPFGDPHAQLKFISPPGIWLEYWYWKLSWKYPTVWTLYHWASTRIIFSQKYVTHISAEVGHLLRIEHGMSATTGLILLRALTGTCNPEETSLPGLPVSWSPTLFSGSGPIGLPPVPWTKKKKLKGRQFSSDAEVIADAGTWLDGQ